MARFTDAAAEEWEIDITAGTIKQLLQSELKIDLGKPDEGDPPLVTRVHNDVGFLVDLLWELCREQCEAREIKPIDFARRLKGEALAGAYVALKESWADFFRCLRPDLAEVIERAGAWAEKLAASRVAKMQGPGYEEAVNKALAAAEAVLDEELAAAPERVRDVMRRPGKSAASSPPSPDVIPLPERSES